MPAALVDADSLLAVDIGTLTTRAALFDVVDGHYRFIASGEAASTVLAPLRDAGECARKAIEVLQEVSGRKFLRDDLSLIQPESDGRGVDTFSVTLSAGPVIDTAVAGLLDDVSLESVQRLARSLKARVVESIGLNDGRKPEEHIDTLVYFHPDLVLMAGGTDGGATASVKQLVETVGLACYLLPAEQRPALLFAGNQALSPEVLKILQPLTSFIRVSPNLRPGIDSEDLQPASRVLTELFFQVRRRQMNGLDDLNRWAKNTLTPTSHAMGRMIRFLSRIYDPDKGILGVDLGAGAATVAAGFGGRLSLGVYPQLGLGEGLAHLPDFTRLEDIRRWIPFKITADGVRDYLLQKSIHPASLPATREELLLEQAAARACLHAALEAVGRDFPADVRRADPNLQPFFEPVIAAGSVFSRAPSPGQSLLMLLDAIQPVGITTLIIDQYSLLPALGSAAGVNPVLPVQVLESGAFLGLATVVAPLAAARPGTVVMKARLVDQNGNESRADVRQGSLEILPLAPGQSGRLFLQLQHGAQLGSGRERIWESGIPVTGTVLGVVLDGRGRPVCLPHDDQHRQESLKRWLAAVGG